MDLVASRRRMALVGVPVVVLLVAAFWWFRPDALVTDRTVDEELDPALAAALAASPDPSPSTIVSPVTTPSPVSSSPAVPTTSTTPVAPTSSPDPEPSRDTPSDDESAVVADPVDDPSTPAEPAAPEPGPESEPEPAAPRVLARGEWVSLEHDTTGTVALVDDGDDLHLSLVDLDTSNGPDLRVILSPKVGVGGDWFGYDDGATELGRLKGNRGTQVYDVPDDIDVDEVASVVIWCERFAVGFGAANLT